MVLRNAYEGIMVIWARRMEINSEYLFLRDRKLGKSTV